MKTKVITILLTILVISVNASAKEIILPDGCEVVRCTCYLPTGNRTADGTEPFEGICASNSEHLGEAAVVYDMDLRIIGIYDCRDTGSHPELKDGTRIDIFCKDEEAIREWQEEVGDYVIVQWVKGEG